jgi:hypothetical protein
MYEVQHYRSNQLPDSIYQQFASFVRLVWLSHLQGDDRFWRLVDPTGQVDHFVIAERDVLISHASVSQRTLNHRGETYTMRGLGGVFTYPAFRKEGHGAKVVAAVTEFIRSTDADLGMLFTDPVREPFYGAHGWQALKPLPGILSGDPQHPTVDAESFAMMLYLSEKAKAHRDDFLHGPIYVGEDTW